MRHGPVANQLQYKPVTNVSDLLEKIRINKVLAIEGTLNYLGLLITSQ